MKLPVVPLPAAGLRGMPSLDIFAKGLDFFTSWEYIDIWAEGGQMAAPIWSCTGGIGEESPDSTGQGAP